MSKKQITISEVLQLLDKGMDRKAIKAKLGLTHSEMAALFQHPKLKFRKPKASVSFELIDDTEEGGDVNGGEPEEVWLEDNSEKESEDLTSEDEEETISESQGIF